MHVEYIDHMGDDLAVVNAARVSYNKESQWETTLVQRYQQPAYIETKLSKPDKDLINFLARGMSSKDYYDLIDAVCKTNNPRIVEELLWKFRKTPTHKAPFGHCFLSVRVKAPIFVARQLVKHKFLRMSEVSRRYVASEVEFYFPSQWRGKAKNNKQGSDESVSINTAYYDRDDGYNTWEDDAVNVALESYEKLLELGVAPEQARMILPQNMMTEWEWSGSLDAFADMCNLRLDTHAQKETREVAEQISAIAQKYFPVSWEALVLNGKTQ